MSRRKCVLRDTGALGELRPLSVSTTVTIGEDLRERAAPHPALNLPIADGTDSGFQTGFVRAHLRRQSLLVA